MPEIGAAEVRLRIPSSTQFVRVARMALSATVGPAGFDIEEVEDLRIAVTELASMLIDCGGPDIDLVIRLRDGGVEVVGTTPATGAPELDELTEQILNAIVEDYAVSSRDGAAQFFFTKSASRGS
jgi:serine/threonine-protein kinase RsbW